MTDSPLDGAVTKAVLLVRPAYAQEKELLHFLKFKLFDAGFIVCREEYRRFNAELAHTICAEYDALPSYMPPSTSIGDGEGATVVPAHMLPSPMDMVGNVYVYVLARRDCHAALHKFVVDTLLTDHSAEKVDSDGDADNEVSYQALITAVAEHQGLGTQPAMGMPGEVAPLGAPYGPPPAIFLNRSADGARKSVATLFPRMLATDVPNATQSREYVQANLKTALLPALTELAKKKPEDPLRWLAEHLLMNNPASPPMVNQGY